MDIEEMTPAQLREYAAQKEAAKDSLMDLYINEGADPRWMAREPKRDPWVKDVEFESIAYPVDVRRTKSLAFIRQLAKVQKTSKEGRDNNPDMEPVIELFDTLFGGECHDMVVARVTAKMGYDDFAEIYRIESGILENLDLKN